MPALRASLADVLVPIPRRQNVIAPSMAAPRPNTHPLAFRAGLFATIGRLTVWCAVCAGLLASRLADKLAGKDTLEQRAVRVRLALERVGGTFVKFGQQVAIRIDVVPWEYCVELSKMLDRMPPFPVEQALAAVERAAGRPWTEVFSVFDPQPVGSASIACVFQAVLKDGSKVAVKVRRPGIGNVFAADFRVLDWLCTFVEALAIIRPGFTRDLRREFRETLLEELDFRKEAQFQHIFRRKAPRESGRDFLTAPKVYADLSSDEVIVQEFVTGMWLWEVIATVERQDPAGLALLAQMNIDPALVARRILWSGFWSMEENLFFHADPHPANIVIGENSTVTFIDFGSCGSFNNEQRWAMQRIARAMRADDAEGMARATLKLMEPFPPIDVTGVMKEIQDEYTRVLYTFRTKAKHTEWWERTSARQWLATVKVAHKYNLPFNLHTLRMMRATLLYDTVVVRLDHSIDRYDEYVKFVKDQESWARKRWRRRQRQNRVQLALRAADLASTASDLLERAQQTLSSPVAEFSSIIDKSVFAFTVLTRMVARLIAVGALAAAIVGARAYARTGAVSLTETLWTVAYSPFFAIAAAGVIALNVRHILFRFREADHKGRSGR